MFADAPICPGRRYGKSSFVACAMLLVATLLPSQPALAEVEWRSGRLSVPLPMQPAELGQALAQLANRPERSRIVIHFEGPVQPTQRGTLESTGIRLLSYLGGHAYFATLTVDVDSTRAALVPGMLAVEAIDGAPVFVQRPLLRDASKWDSELERESKEMAMLYRKLTPGRG